MARSATATELLADLDAPTVKLGDIRKMAKAIKTDHDLGLELWASGNAHARRLAILVFDKKRVDQAFVDELEQSLPADVELAERTDLIDWLLANQLSKSKRGRNLIESWADSASSLQRRTYWYHQARLRWTGQTPPNNTLALLDGIEAKLADEAPEVQWAMNFCAGQIGVHEPAHRDRCVALGERVGLYRDEVERPGCTPSYLPRFIETLVAKNT